MSSSLVTLRSSQPFLNGTTYALSLASGKPIETVDTFLPVTTKTTLERHTNHLENDYDIGDRHARWMIGISTMSGCPVKCPFCAVTGVTEKHGLQLLTWQEMLAQVEFVLAQNPEWDFRKTQQLKVQLTRMGEPALNMDVIELLPHLHQLMPTAKIFISTVGIQNRFLDALLAVRETFFRDKDFLQLQFSVHTTNEARRRELQPKGKLMSFEEIGKFGPRWVRPGDRKITLNFALTGVGALENHDFQPYLLKQWFDPKYFFVKLSPLNDNEVSERHNLVGVIPQHNFI